MGIWVPLSQTLFSVAEVSKHRIFLKNYRKIMTREHIKSMIDIANGTIKMLQDYISFLENELNVLEETE